MSDKDKSEQTLEKAFEALPNEFSGFRTVYDRDIVPLLQAREGDRVAAAQKARNGRMVGIFVGLMGVVALVFAKHPLVLVLAGVIGFGIHSFMSRDLRAVGQDAKSLIVQSVAEQFSLSFEAAPQVPDTISRHHKLGLVPGWDRANYEDLLTGTRKGVDFELFEAKLEERRESTSSSGSRRTKWVTVFKGQCLKLSFDKRFFGRTMVTRDAGFFNRFGGGGGMERAKLEDPHFEKIFEVYTTDQVEARFLLTPDLMERLIELENAFHGGKLKCCFDGGDVLLTVQGGDLFEPGSMFLPMDNPDRVVELVKDFAAVFHLVDSINKGRAKEADARGA